MGWDLITPTRSKYNIEKHILINTYYSYTENHSNYLLINNTLITDEPFLIGL